MYIHEAVKKAVEENKLIYRTGNGEWNGWTAKGREGSIRRRAILPTNSYETCMFLRFINGEEDKRCSAWNPTADDLMADDWEVMEYPAQKSTP